MTKDFEQDQRSESSDASSLSSYATTRRTFGRPDSEPGGSEALGRVETIAAFSYAEGQKMGVRP